MNAPVVSYILVLIGIINTYFLYFYEGFAPMKTQSIWAFVTIGLLTLTFLFLLSYHISHKRIIKKGMLRLSMLIVIALFLVSVYTRITEAPTDIIYMVWRWSQTVFYGLLLLTILSVSYKFYIRLRELADKKNNYL